MEMLNTSRFSDIKIICDGFHFKVHKFVLYQDSPFFATLINGPFHESHSNTCTIQETSILAVAFLVLGIYTNDWGVKEAYEVWPDLQKIKHLSLEYPSNDRVFNANKAHERSLNEKQTASLLEIQTSIRLYEFADRLLRPELSKRAVGRVERRLRDNFDFCPQPGEPLEKLAFGNRAFYWIYTDTPSLGTGCVA